MTEPEFRWTWTRSLFLRAEKAFALNADNVRWKRLRPVIIAVPVLILLWAYSLSGGLTIVEVALAATLGLGGPALGGKIGGWVQSVLRARSIAKELRASESTMSVSLQAEHFRIAWTDGSLEVAWRSVRRAVDTAEFVLLFCTSKSGYYFPKASAIGDAESHVRRIAEALERAGVPFERAGA